MSVTIAPFRCDEPGTGSHSVEEPLNQCNDCGNWKSPSLEKISQSRLSCPICGDISTGYHYGVESCESCKGFFRRAVQRKEVFTCKFDSRCTVSLYTRRNCAACGYNKCIEKGMLTSAVRENRRRGGCKRYAPSPKKEPPPVLGQSFSRCNCSSSSSGQQIQDNSSGGSCLSSPTPNSLVSPSPSELKESYYNISPLLLIKQCFMSYDEYIKQPNQLLEQSFLWSRRSTSYSFLVSPSARSRCTSPQQNAIMGNIHKPPTAQLVLLSNLRGTSMLDVYSPSATEPSDVLHVSEFVASRKQTCYMERNIKWATSFFDQDVTCVLICLANNWITLGFFDYLIQLSGGGPNSPPTSSSSAEVLCSPVPGRTPQSIAFHSSSSLEDRHCLKPGCDPITARENDVMIAKMQNEMNFYAETSGIDIESLEKLLATSYTEEVQGVSLMGIAQQMNELKLTTGEIAIARVILLLSTGLNTTLTGALLRFQVGILQAFESFCKIEDRMTIDPYGRFNSICLVLFDIERYVSSNLATDMKPNNMLSPFLQECPTESQVIQMHYSLSVADKKPSSTMYMSEPPRKIVRTESALIPRHYPVAAGN